MMFVSGETAEPSIETSYLIEEIVREQVIEMVGQMYLPNSAALKEAAQGGLCTSQQTRI